MNNKKNAHTKQTSHPILWRDDTVLVSLWFVLARNGRIFTVRITCGGDVSLSAGNEERQRTNELRRS